MATRDWRLALAVVALVVASGLVVVLAERQVALRHAYDDLRAKARLPYRGLAVPTFRGSTVHGDSITVGELPDSAGRQLLFVFTTTCPFCRATLPVWAALTDSIASSHGAGVEVIGIALDSASAAASYAAEHQLPFPVLTFPDRKTAQLYRARAVPQTVVLNQWGEVLFAHKGAALARACPGLGISRSAGCSGRTGPADPELAARR